MGVEQLLQVTRRLLDIIRLLTGPGAIQRGDVASGADGDSEGVRYHRKDPLGQSFAAEFDHEDCWDTHQHSSNKSWDC